MDTGMVTTATRTGIVETATGPGTVTEMTITETGRDCKVEQTLSPM